MKHIDESRERDIFHLDLSRNDTAKDCDIFHYRYQKRSNPGYANKIRRNGVASKFDRNVIMYHRNEGLGRTQV